MSKRLRKVCIVYNLLLLSLISSKSYPAFKTGSKRLFYSFRPPQEPHRVISIKNGWATVFIGDIHGDGLHATFCDF